jgi:hypothetical protein
LEGPPDQPLFDATAEADAAVAQLLGADVVVTSYDVLQQVGLMAIPQVEVRLGIVVLQQERERGLGAGGWGGVLTSCDL